MTNTRYDNQDDFRDVLDIIYGMTTYKGWISISETVKKVICDMHWGESVHLKRPKFGIDFEIICFNETEKEKITEFNPLLANSKRPDCINKTSYLFWSNPEIDMTKIWNSMLIRSGTTIAYYVGYKGVVSIEVRGNINFTYTSKNEPDIHHAYVDPSQYTNDVTKTLNGYAVEPDLPGDVDIEDGNWFEIFFTPYDKNGYLRSDYSHSDTEPEGCSPEELFDIMKEYYDCPL